jgi:hypothetical protein
MTERELDLRLERELREALRGRDPGRAPYGLHGRVDRIPDEAPAARTGRVARAIGAVIGAAAVVTIAAGLVSIGARRGTDAAGPGGGPAGSPLPVVPGNVAPAGLVAHPDIQGLALAFAVLAGGILALSIGLFVLRRPRAGALALVVGLAIPAAVVALAVVPGVTGDERFGSSTSPTIPVAMPPGYAGESLIYLGAGPGEAFETSFALVNGGPLPVTVHGIVAGSGGSLDPAWIEVRLVPDWESPVPGAITRVDGEPFAPFGLAPGAAMQVRLVGTPGACAVGAAFDPGGEDALDYQPVPIQVAYDIAGWPRVDPITLSYRLLVPVWATCQPAAVLPKT